MKKLWIVILGIVFILMLSTCGNTSHKGSSSHKYSDTYYKDSSYRKNVKEIADVYDISEADVDAKINAVTGGK